MESETAAPESSATAGGSAPGPRLILGLGNPGDRYRESRHNLGFKVVEELLRRRGWTAQLECEALVASGDGVWLAKPLTYMNRSGHAARCLAERRGLEPRQVLVIYDELALPLGQLRLRPAGSPAGHRGMESVLDSLRTDQVPRLRLGIAPEEPPEGGDEQVEFVLAPFDDDEQETAEAMVQRAADACEAWLEKDVQTVMNEFNSDRP